MNKFKFKDVVLKEGGFLRGPFGGDLKKEIFVPKGKDTYKVYEQGVVLNEDSRIGRYYITKEYFDEKMHRFEVKPNDFLISCSGVNYGAIYQLKGNIEPGVINQALLRVRLNKDIIDDNYFFYFFKFHIVKMIVGRKGDSTIPNFPALSVIKNLEFSLPELNVQKMIGKLLYKLDKKNEINNKINAELESMAKTIYDYWFVQFDFPDKNGNPYKCSGGKMIWNEKLKKEIPEGWEVKEMNELLTKNKETYSFNNRDVEIGTIDLSIMPSATMCLNDKSSSKNFKTNLFQLKKYDILFGGIRPYLLKAGFAPFNGLVTGTVHSFKANESDEYNFLILTMTHKSMFAFAVHNSKGTKMPVIGIDDLLDYKVTYSKEIIQKFNELIYFKENYFT
jgi:restriction endonuclease S subunit